jgi:hypothetical protein
MPSLRVDFAQCPGCLSNSAQAYCCASATRILADEEHVTSLYEESVCIQREHETGRLVIDKASRGAIFGEPGPVTAPGMTLNFRSCS